MEEVEFTRNTYTSVVTSPFSHLFFSLIKSHTLLYTFVTLRHPLVHSFTHSLSFPLTFSLPSLSLSFLVFISLSLISFTLYPSLPLVSISLFIRNILSVFSIIYFIIFSFILETFHLITINQHTFRYHRISFLVNFIIYN